MEDPEVFKIFEVCGKYTLLRFNLVHEKFTELSFLDWPALEGEIVG